AAALEIANDVRVVDDLLANIDRRPVQLKGLLHSLDCPLDAGAIAPGRGEDQPLDHRPQCSYGRHRADGRTYPDGLLKAEKPAARGGKRGGPFHSAHRGSTWPGTHAAVRIAQW